MRSRPITSYQFPLILQERDFQLSTLGTSRACGIQADSALIPRCQLICSYPFRLSRRTDQEHDRYCIIGSVRTTTYGGYGRHPIHQLLPEGTPNLAPRPFAQLPAIYGLERARYWLRRNRTPGASSLVNSTPALSGRKGLRHQLS